MEAPDKLTLRRTRQRAIGETRGVSLVVSFHAGEGRLEFPAAAHVLAGDLRADRGVDVLGELLVGLLPGHRRRVEVARLPALPRDSVSLTDEGLQVGIGLLLQHRPFADLNRTTSSLP